jgi:hypothetical protein
MIGSLFDQLVAGLAGAVTFAVFVLVARRTLRAAPLDAASLLAGWPPATVRSRRVSVVRTGYDPTSGACARDVLR